MDDLVVSDNVPVAMITEVGRLQFNVTLGLLPWPW